MIKKLAWEKWYDKVEDDISIFGEDIDDQQDLQLEDQGVTSAFSPEMFFIPEKISTPFGTYDASDPLCPTNLFECWIGHSNFPICEKEYTILNEEVDGVGAFKVISKYRFFIGIEKLFNFSVIRKDIEKKLCNSDEDLAGFGV